MRDVLHDIYWLCVLIGVSALLALRRVFTGRWEKTTR
jgi:hypothetical protein